MSRWNCTVTDWPADHAYFAVFDGHGGDTVSEHASNNLHAKIIDAKRYDPARYPGFTPSWEDAIRNGFDAEEREIEKQIIGGTPEDVALGRVAMREGGTPPPKGGATAVVVLFLPDEKRLLVANVGDSRAILASTDKAEPEEEFVQIAKAEGAKIVDFEARPGEGSGKRQEGGGKEVDILKDADEAMQESAPETIVPLAKGVPATVRRLTHDDTPDAKSEKMRVQLAGGRIVAGRVGAINMTRALGDVRYKWPWNTVRFHYDRGNIAIAQPIVMDDFITARPHLISQPLEPNKLHLAILASDGLWDSKGFEDDLAVIERVSELWETSPRPYVSAQDICETLCKEAVARWVGKADNVSVVIALIGP